MFFTGSANFADWWGIVACIAPVAVGLYLGSRFRGSVRWLIALPLILFGILLLSLPVERIKGSGGWQALEIEAQFYDRRGQPVAGITLRAEDPAGYAMHWFPVDDFTPDQTPTSGDDGVLRFHHLGSRLSANGTILFGVIHIGEPQPEYYCRFMRGDRTIARIRFGRELYTQPLSSVDRLWTDLPPPASQPLENELVFDANGNGQLDGGERWAQFNVWNRWDDYLARERAGQLPTRMIQFAVKQLSFTVLD